MTPTIQEGQQVKIKGSEHCGIFTVSDCEWFECSDGSGYWRAKCYQDHEADFMPDQCGIVVASSWSGPVENLVPVN